MCFSDGYAAAKKQTQFISMADRFNVLIAQRLTLRLSKAAETS